jgi:hypothetical protein
MQCHDQYNQDDLNGMIQQKYADLFSIRVCLLAVEIP